MPKGLCIGGAADGKWYVHEGRVLRVPIDEPINWDITLSKDPQPIRIDEYRLELFVAGETLRLYLWVLEGMSIEEAVTKLFEDYKP